VDRQQPPKTRKNSPQPPTLRGRALRLLGRREFSRQELEKRLRGYVDPDNPAELDTLLDDLAERGWLSDARYADAVVRKRTGQFARRSIAQELKRAGVDEAVTAAALAEVDPDQEFAAALALCRRKFRRAPADQKEKARQIRFLQSRGYSLSLALRVLKHGAGQNEDTG
jgi:regulatory protein